MNKSGTGGGQATDEHKTGQQLLDELRDVRRRMSELRASEAERKRAEERIEALNAELEQHVIELKAANRELEAFCYSVSHGLRAARSIPLCSKRRRGTE